MILICRSCFGRCEWREMPCCSESHDHDQQRRCAENESPLGNSPIQADRHRTMMCIQRPTPFRQTIRPIVAYAIRRQRRRSGCKRIRLPFLDPSRELFPARRMTDHLIHVGRIRRVGADGFEILSRSLLPDTAIFVNESACRHHCSFAFGALPECCLYAPLMPPVTASHLQPLASSHE